MFLVFFVKTKRGTQCLQMGDYRYYKSCEVALKIRWACSYKLKNGCRACVYTYNDVVLSCRGTHINCTWTEQKTST